MCLAWIRLALVSPLQSLLSRCRTYGDAVHEISTNYKNVLKELQREHNTGRDVLLSLKTTGLLR